MKDKCLSNVYGFEEYTLASLSERWFDGYYYSYMRDPLWNTGYDFLQDKPEYHTRIKPDLTYGAEFTKNPYENHKELLIPGKSMYIHPSCKISRTLAYTKFTRVINPWLADIVVMPEIGDHDLGKFSIALFINEEKKVIAAVRIEKAWLRDRFKELQEGVKLKEVLTSELEHVKIPGHDNYDETIEIFEESTFMCVDTFLRISREFSYFIDALTGVIPLEKTVFENSVQEALADETNKPDLTTLLSIRDMLGSSDVDTVGAAIKALSVLDYVHYPNSITCILKTAKGSNWQYHRVLNSTAVKFMCKQLYGHRWRKIWRLGGKYQDDISEEDYNLFQELYKEIHHLHDKEDVYLAWVKTISFVTSILGGEAQIRLKQVA